jgi:hypothetical protein
MCSLLDPAASWLPPPVTHSANRFAMLIAAPDPLSKALGSLLPPWDGIELLFIWNCVP